MLTLPLIQGRLMKARPILPDTVHIVGEPEAFSPTPPDEATAPTGPS